MYWTPSPTKRSSKVTTESERGQSELGGKKVESGCSGVRKRTKSWTMWLGTGPCDWGLDQIARLCDFLQKFLATSAWEKQKPMAVADGWRWQSRYSRTKWCQTWWPVNNPIPEIMMQSIHLKRQSAEPTLHSHPPCRYKPQLDRRAILWGQNLSGHFKPLEFLGLVRVLKEWQAKRYLVGGPNEAFVNWCHNKIWSISPAPNFFSFSTEVVLKPLHSSESLKGAC